MAIPTNDDDLPDNEPAFIAGFVGQKSSSSRWVKTSTGLNRATWPQFC